MNQLQTLNMNLNAGYWTFRNGPFPGTVCPVLTVADSVVPSHMIVQASTITLKTQFLSATDRRVITGMYQVSSLDLYADQLLHVADTAMPVREVIVAVAAASRFMPVVDRLQDPQFLAAPRCLSACQPSTGQLVTVSSPDGHQIAVVIDCILNSVELVTLPQHDSLIMSHCLVPASHVAAIPRIDRYLN